MRVIVINKDLKDEEGRGIFIVVVKMVDLSIHIYLINQVCVVFYKIKVIGTDI